MVAIPTIEWSSIMDIRKISPLKKQGRFLSPLELKEGKRHKKNITFRGKKIITHRRKLSPFREENYHLYRRKLSPFGGRKLSPLP